MHLKFVDPKVRERVRAEKLSLAEAVPLGVMVEPPYGEPAVPPLLDALAGLDREIFTILEQDLYPVDARTIPSGRPGRAGRLPRRLRPGPGPALAVLTFQFVPKLAIRKDYSRDSQRRCHRRRDHGQDHIRRITYVVSGARVSAVTDMKWIGRSPRSGGLPGVPCMNRAGAHRRPRG